jgi:hypothetical protein
LIVHLRDGMTNNPYQMSVAIYYATPEEDRVDVDRQLVEFRIEQTGELLFKFA